MITKPNEISADEEIHCDICIIGSGVAGLTVAREFMNTDKNIVVLESGDLKPNSDINDLISGENVGIPYYDIKDTRTRALGGSAHLWFYVPGLRLRRMDRIDFEKKDWIPYSGWPITKKDLDPYYESAHKLLKIGPYNYDVKDWIEPDEHNYLQTEESDSFKTTMFQFARKDVFYNDYYDDFDKADNIKVLLNSTVLNIDTTENSKEVTHLTVSAQNEFEFKVKANNFILAAGGLENPRLLLLSNDHAKRGLGNNHGLVGRFFMEHPHIWGNNAVGTYYPSESEKFNANEIYHFHYRKGHPVLGYLIFNDEILKKHKLLNITFGIRGESIKRPAGYQEGKSALRNVLSNIKHGRIGKDMIRELSSFFSHGTVVLYEGLRNAVNGKVDRWDRFGVEETGISINLMSEQSPNPESRVLLGEERDHFGQRKMQLDWRLTDYDFESMKKSVDILNAALQEKGLGYVDNRLNTDKDTFIDKIKGGYHHMGTTRMHEDATLGVTDANCKIHGIRNLYIAGSSVFPTSGYANPTLTLAALSIRLAEHLKKVMKNKMTV